MDFAISFDCCRVFADLQSKVWRPFVVTSDCLTVLKRSLRRAAWMPQIAAGCWQQAVATLILNNKLRATLLLRPTAAASVRAVVG